MPEAKKVICTIQNPTATWELTSGDGSAITISVNHRRDWPDDVPPPKGQGDPADRHPYPNRLFLNVHERDVGATEAQAALTRAEAEQLHHALGAALAWDGQ